MLEQKEGIENYILYRGQQYDQEAGQYYLRARYYNPVIGRFMQEDTYRGDGLNLYAYCGNNPVMYYDPSGHDKVTQPSREPERPRSGGEGGTPTKITNNLGKEIDITPSTNHTTTTKNPGLKGTPNSSIDIVDSAGNIKTRRWYGSDGTQIRDVDFTNHGNPKLHPEWPHEHGAR